MTYEEFVKKVKRLEPGEPFIYFAGGDLAATRRAFPKIDKIARFVRACYELEYGELFQYRVNSGTTHYTLVLRVKLGMRKDGNGRFQEAERMAAYY